MIYIQNRINSLRRGKEKMLKKSKNANVHYYPNARFNAFQLDMLYMIFSVEKKLR